MTLSKERKGEIALAALKYQLKNKDIKINTDMKRGLGNVAKDTGIPLKELMAFAKELLSEALDEALEDKE